MKDSRTSGEKPTSTKRAKGAPIGTHSLTGDSASVGIASPADGHAKPKRTSPRDLPPGAREYNPQADARANALHPVRSAVEPDEAPDDHVPTPDEDGPHDVPDEKVIEKTLPSVPISDSAGGGSGQMR